MLYAVVDRSRRLQKDQRHPRARRGRCAVESHRRTPRAAVRETDHVARLGGDEFAIVLAQTCELLSVEIVCRRILKSIMEPVMWRDTAMRVSASIGSARCPIQGTTMGSLYKCADLALYEAKRSGRNTWRWSRQPLGEGAQGEGGMGVAPAG